MHQRHRPRRKSDQITGPQLPQSDAGTQFHPIVHGGSRQLLALTAPMANDFRTKFEHRPWYASSSLQTQLDSEGQASKELNLVLQLCQCHAIALLVVNARTMRDLDLRALLFLHTCLPRESCVHPCLCRGTLLRSLNAQEPPIETAQVLLCDPKPNLRVRWCAIAKSQPADATPPLRGQPAKF